MQKYKNYIQDVLHGSLLGTVAVERYVVFLLWNNLSKHEVEMRLSPLNSLVFLIK